MSHAASGTSVAHCNGCEATGGVVYSINGATVVSLGPEGWAHAMTPLGLKWYCRPCFEAIRSEDVTLSGAP